jgi:hypothetical protein
MERLKITKKEERDFLRCAGVWLWGRYQLIYQRVPVGMRHGKCDQHNLFKLSWIGMEDSRAEMKLIVKEIKSIQDETLQSQVKLT